MAKRCRSARQMQQIGDKLPSFCNPVNHCCLGTNLAKPLISGCALIPNTLLHDIVDEATAIGAFLRYPQVQRFANVHAETEAPRDGGYWSMIVPHLISFSQIVVEPC